MSAFFEKLNEVFNTFGAAVFIPVVIFIIALVMKVPKKKALMSGLAAGVGLQGFTLLINAYGGIITPVIQQMCDESGINLPIFDLGWQAASIVAYSTQIGMIFLGLCIVLQVLLYVSKFTNIFQASDLWNNYSYMIWGSMVYLTTHNVWLSLGCMILLLLITTLCAEMLARRWSNYYRYPGCAHASLHACITVPYAIAVNWLLNKLGLDKIKADPVSFQKKLGFMGDPMTIGAVVGLIIGLVGNAHRLNTLAAWGTIATCTISTAAIIAIFPKIAAIFAGAFAPLTDASRKSVKSGDRGEWYLAINDAACYGESCTLISGIICMPIIFLLAFIMPGNMVLPVLSLTAIPYLIVAIVPISNGNMVKTIISTMGYLIISLYVCTYLAPMFTQIATSVGLELSAGVLLVAAYSLMGSPISMAVTMAFISQNPLWIGLSVVIYLICFVLFRKNRSKVVDFIEREAVGAAPAEADA